MVTQGGLVSAGKALLISAGLSVLMVSLYWSKLMHLVNWEC